MKKHLLFLSAALTLGLLLSSCSSSSKTGSSGTLLGLWQCTDVSSSVAGKNISGLADNKYLKLFTIGFAGINNGVYARVGQSGSGAAADLSAVAAAASALYSGTGKVSDWKKFLTRGSFSTDGNTLTLTRSNDGGVETYTYSISGNTLSLSQEIANASSNATVSNVVSVLNSVLGSQQQINTSANIVYTYKRATIAEIIASFKSMNQ
ncbi:MAG: hypothetical protein K6D57_07350 [Paludibacteraceae bacterium]|nr:hypothetical protein [Paludibacteraceae bacterium]